MTPSLVYRQDRGRDLRNASTPRLARILTTFIQDKTNVAPSVYVEGTNDIMFRQDNWCK
jgi:hypothetical protein